MRVRGLAAVLILLASLSASAMTPRELWAKFDRAVFQLYQRDWGRLVAICSAGAYEAVNESGRVYTRLLTAAHCVSDPRAEYVISRDGSVFYDVRVVAIGWPWDPVNRRYLQDEGDDWAILETSTVWLFNDEVDEPGVQQPGIMEPGLDVDVYLGMPIFVLGYPLGGDKLAAAGIVGNPSYAATGTPWRRYIGAQIFSRPGSSGSLVVNEEGKIIGILVAGAGEQLHLLTPIRKVRFELADQGARNGRPASPPLP